MPDVFSPLFGDRRGAAHIEPPAPEGPAADSYEPWWWDTENNPAAGGSHMDLRRWLDARDADGCNKLELSWEARAVQDGGWLLTCCRRPGQSPALHRTLRAPELEWLRRAWPEHLRSKLSNRCFRGELR